MNRWYRTNISAALGVAIMTLVAMPGPAFAEGRPSDHSLDKRLAKELTRQGFTGTIESQLEQRLGRPIQPALANLGRLIFFDNVQGLHNDNSCSGCHGPAGAGIPAQYPRLSGQFAEYVAAQLKGFKEGARANDPNATMRGVAARMTDLEIRAVAEYAAGLR